jgi:GntR family transcriptional regulator
MSKRPLAGRTSPKIGPGRAAAAPMAPELRQLLADTQPRYASVAASLAAEILDHRRAVGDLLPTEQELSQGFNVSRSTVREALRRLREMGLVAGSQGVGTRVVSNRPRSSYTMTIGSVADVMGYATRTRLEITGRDRLRVDADQAEGIGAAAGSEWIHIHGTRWPEGQDLPPISLVNLYVATAFTDVTELPDLVATPAYRLIERHHGIAVAEVQQEITAVALDAVEADLLQVRPASPGLRIRRRFYAADGRLLESTRNLHASSDRFAYSLRLGAIDS